MLKELKEQKGNKKNKDEQGKKEQYMISTLFWMIKVDIYDS